MRLALGTCLYGMDYGILGQKQPSSEDAVDFMEYAVHNGIDAIDTAEAYGNSQEVVGRFLQKKTVKREELFISTKMLPNSLDDVSESDYDKIIRDHLIKSLRTLNTEYVDAYLFHSARYAFRPELIKALAKVKKEGLALKVGVSVYEPEEAKACFDSDDVDFIQLPYSIFDHRMRNANVFQDNMEQLRKNPKNATEIHSRSAFIQGLVLANENDVPEFLSEVRPVLGRVRSFCSEENIDIVHLAISYVLREKAISHLVFGADNIEQIKQNIDCASNPLGEEYLQEVDKMFKDIPADIVMPSLWKRKSIERTN